jgi:hypothetical protein
MTFLYQECFLPPATCDADFFMSVFPQIRFFRSHSWGANNTWQHQFLPLWICYGHLVMQQRQLWWSPLGDIGVQQQPNDGDITIVPAVCAI